MEAINAFAEKRPLVFSILTLLFWVLAGALLVGGSAALLGVPIFEDVPQIFGTLGATLVLLAIAGRLGWLRSMGFTRLGGWRVWLITIPLLAYLIAAYVYGFFGNLSFDFGIFARSEAARRILVRDGIVGFVEETLFRGIVLYALVRVWGHSKRGLIAAVVVQAVLFGVYHLLQSTVGISLTIVLLVIVNCILSGLWWGALVVRWGSLWPVIVLHGLSNLAVQAKGLTSASIEPVSMGYIRGTLMELPLVIFGVWLLLRMSQSSKNVVLEAASQD